MLKDIVISKVRVKLLTIFFNSPGQIIHVRELVRRTGEEINAVRRELLHMEKAGMVAKEQRANRLYYSIRKDYPLYFDLLELITKEIWHCFLNANTRNSRKWLSSPPRSYAHYRAHSTCNLCSACAMVSVRDQTY